MKLFIVLTIALAVLTGCQYVPSTTDTKPPTASSTAVTEIAPADAAPKTQEAYAQFIDVRTEAEYKAGHADRAVNIPLDTIEQNLDRIEKNEPVYVICETGRRSKEASEVLAKNGYRMVYNVTGGTSAWRSEGLPMAKQAEK